MSEVFPNTSDVSSSASTNGASPSASAASSSARGVRQKTSTASSSVSTTSASPSTGEASPKLRICHLYPDILNLYGDRGNIITLQKRCEWRGISCEVVELCAGDDADFDTFDLFFIGGGQDFDQYALMDDFGIGKSGSKADRLCQAIENNKVVLAICGGYQLLGKYYVGTQGQKTQFLGALPLYTEAGDGRLIGNMAFQVESLPEKPVVVGFENHVGRTYLCEGAKPFGKVKAGFGNNGEDKTEGIIYKNVFGTYAHGPLLPKNPIIADELLSRALMLRYDSLELSKLNDKLETRAHDSVLKKVLQEA